MRIQRDIKSFLHFLQKWVGKCEIERLYFLVLFELQCSMEELV